MSSARTAGLIGASFGTVFVLVNAGAAASPWDLVLRAVGLVAGVAVGVRLLRTPDRPVDPRPGALRVYWASVALEVVVIVLGARLLGAAGLGEYGVAWVAAVVGLHFLPFAWAFRLPGFGVLGLVLVGVAALGALVGALGGGAPAVALVAGVGAGAVLIASASLRYGAPPTPASNLSSSERS